MINETPVRWHGNKMYINPEGRCRNILVVGAIGYRFTIGGMVVDEINRKYHLVRLDKFMQRLRERLCLSRSGWTNLSVDEVMLMTLSGGEPPFDWEITDPEHAQWNSFDFNVIGAVLTPIPGFASPDLRNGPRIYYKSIN